MKSNHRGPYLVNICVLKFMHMNINNEVTWIIYVKLITYILRPICVIFFSLRTRK